MTQPYVVADLVGGILKKMLVNVSKSCFEQTKLPCLLLFFFAQILVIILIIIRHQVVFIKDFAFFFNIIYGRISGCVHQCIDCRNFTRDRQNLVFVARSVPFSHQHLIILSAYCNLLHALSFATDQRQRRSDALRHEVRFIIFQGDNLVVLLFDGNFNLCIRFEATGDHLRR